MSQTAPPLSCPAHVHGLPDVSPPAFKLRWTAHLNHAGRRSTPLALEPQLEGKSRCSLEPCALVPLGKLKRRFRFRHPCALQVAPCSFLGVAPCTLPCNFGGRTPPLFLRSHPATPLPPATCPARQPRRGSRLWACPSCAGKEPASLSPCRRGFPLPWQRHHARRLCLRPRAVNGGCCLIRCAPAMAIHCCSTQALPWQKVSKRRNFAHWKVNTFQSQ